MTESWRIWAFIALAYLAAIFLQKRRRAREAAGLIPFVEITVRVPARLLECFAVTYFVPMFYMLLAGPTIRHARENRDRT